jgi:hypothetical protein
MLFIDAALVHNGSHVRQIYQIEKFRYIRFKNIQKNIPYKICKYLSSVKSNTPECSGAY